MLLKAYKISSTVVANLQSISTAEIELSTHLHGAMSSYGGHGFCPLTAADKRSKVKRKNCIAMLVLFFKPRSESVWNSVNFPHRTI